MSKRNFIGVKMSLTIAIFSCMLVSGNVIGNEYNEEAGKNYLNRINTDVQLKTTESVLTSWAYESNITDENLRRQLDVSAKLANYTKEIWMETIKYPWKSFKDSDVKRQFQKFSVLGTAILSPQKYERYNKIVSDMQSIYGKAKICNFYNRSNCYMQLEPELTEIFAKSRDPEELRYYWEAWRNAAGKPVREMYKEYVDLSNEAAVLNNFTNNAEFWLKDYEADDFKEQVEELWQQLKPLYLQLHAYVRRRLREQYGEKHVSKTGPIPAHLLGNMWSQSWGNIFDFTVPYPGKPSMDVTPTMIEQGYTPLRMFKLAEEFFTSLNLSPMPESFWKNSILEKPKDGRDLICHASAWDFYDGKDFRIKQCTRVTFRQLVTVHHEMGHIQYYLQYKNQPKIYRRGANPGFHEAVGDVMALSVSTPKHLRKIGLLKDTQDDKESEINQLFSIALDKIAFLPFGYLMDQWRWSVFEGETTEKDYNCKWWRLREKYQGLSPPVTRSEDDFDPGAKYHTVGNVPYIRYFVSFVIQFQFHRSLCIAANEFDPNDPASKPLHKCDIYQSREAGDLLKKMLQMGSSKPWPDAMEVITGQRKMDARALLDYFATLQTWLEEENKRTGEFIGWESSQKVCDGKVDLGGVTPSSSAEGNFQDDNIAYSYAEFVRQDDNSFGVPDYLEEVEPSYHALIHTSDDNGFHAKYLLPTKNYAKTNDVYLPQDTYLKSQENIIDISQLKRIKNQLERKSHEQTASSQKVYDDTMYKIFEVPIDNIQLKKPFDVRSKNQDIEKTKILNIILKDLHQMRMNKGTGNKMGNNGDTFKLISNRDASKSEVKPEKGSGEKEKVKNSEVKEEKEGEGSKLKEKEETGVDNKSSKEVSSNEKEEKCKVNTESVDVGKSHSECKAETMGKAAGDEGKGECVLEKAKKLKKLDFQIPNIELMWEAELVRSEAEQMLKNFNFSAYDPNFSNISDLTSTTGEESERSLKPSNELHSADLETKKARKTQTFPSLTADEKSFRYNSFKRFKPEFLKDTSEKKKSFKEYNLVDVIPINLRNKPEEKYKLTENKRRARLTKDNEFTHLMIVGKLSESDKYGTKKKKVKKSYKEYHYNVRNPVVYNAVVITSGKNDKSDEAKDYWSKITNRMTSLKKRNLALLNPRIRRGFQPNYLKNFKKKLSKPVKSQKININNILQYYGLATTFVISFYNFLLL